MLVPIAIPVTLPDASMVAVEVLLLLHVPPALPSVNRADVPIHSEVTPWTGNGFIFTVTTFVTLQAAPGVYVIITVPVTLPVTMPVAAPTDAIYGELLLHVPPVITSLNTIVAFIHTADAPEIGDGNGLIATVTVRTQPEGIV